MEIAKRGTRNMYKLGQSETVGMKRREDSKCMFPVKVTSVQKLNTEMKGAFSKVKFLSMFCE